MELNPVNWFYMDVSLSQWAGEQTCYVLNIGCGRAACHPPSKDSGEYPSLPRLQTSEPSTVVEF